MVALPDPADLEHSWKLSRMPSLTHLTASVPTALLRISPRRLFTAPSHSTCPPPPPMPCFTHKRPLSPSAVAARDQLPPKRTKIIHPSMQGLCSSDAPTGTCNRAPAAPACLLSGVDQSHSVRPLTKCHAANEVCGVREHDARVSIPPFFAFLERRGAIVLAACPRRVPPSVRQSFVANDLLSAFSIPFPRTPG